MKIVCGPDHDKRTLEFTLPIYPSLDPLIEKIFCKTYEVKRNYSIGVMLSGGIDSALLYCLVLLENNNIGNVFKIYPYTIVRKDGSYDAAKRVNDFIATQFNLSNDLEIVGDGTLHEMAQVSSGITDVLKTNDFAYCGIIESRPEHSIGWIRPQFRESFRVKYPLLNLQKSHVIDILYKYNLDTLLTLTHSCNFPKVCGECNGCRERAWGINQLGR